LVCGFFVYTHLLS